MSFPRQFRSVRIRIPYFCDELIIPAVLSHPHDNGQAFVFKVGESGWSKVTIE
jgi:hypothetical protein